MAKPVTSAGWRALGYQVGGGEGHSRGWDWAAAWGITDVNYSNGNSVSFNEGVQAYAREVMGSAQAEARGRFRTGRY